MEPGLRQWSIEHQVNELKRPIAAKCLQFMYIIFFSLLYPAYYFWNKRDFQKQTKKNPFYVSRLVRLIEKHPFLYELSMLVLNFPRPTGVYRFLPQLEGKVLQVGCGTGLLNKYAKQRHAAEFVNLDINERYLQYGARKGRLRNYVHSGIYETTLQSQSFDRILFARSFHHIRYHKKAFKECSRLLKEGGQIWILDPVILEERGSGKQMTSGYMANSSIDGVIWRFTKHSLIQHIMKTLPDDLKLVSIMDERQLHLTNYNLKYPQTDILAVISKQNLKE
jgi:SAM-dependent methyltransferase